MHHGSLDVLTHRTFEGSKIEARLLRLNARQIHLRRACWALWPYDNRPVFKRVFGKRHFRTPLFADGSTGTLSHQDAVGDAPNYTLFPCRTVQNGSLWRTVDNQFIVSYLIQIPKTLRLKVNRCRALSSPRPPSARAVYVRTRPQLGLAGVFAFVCGGSSVRRPFTSAGIRCLQSPAPCAAQFRHRSRHPLRAPRGKQRPNVAPHMSCAVLCWQVLFQRARARRRAW